MKKILNTETINGLFTVDIEGVLQETRIGDNIPDDAGNVFSLVSVALSGFHNRNAQTLVLKRLEGIKPIGAYLNAK